MMKHYKEQLLCCDLFVVESLFLQTFYVLLFLEIDTRRIHLAGITAHSDEQWVPQQARQYIWAIEEREETFCGLINDNDRKLNAAFDAVFQSRQIIVIHTPLEAPIANPFAEKWVRSVRQELLNQAHLRRILQTYNSYYNTRRPHQSLSQQSPIPYSKSTSKWPVARRQLLGGILNVYSRTLGNTLLSPQPG